MKTINFLLLTISLTIVKFGFTQTKWTPSNIQSFVEEKEGLKNTINYGRPTNDSIKTFIKIFVKCAKPYDLKKYGFIKSQSFSGIQAGQIPISSLLPISMDSNIESIHIARKARLQIEDAKNQIHADKTHNGINLPQAYFGEGVIVGIVDIGFDYTHPDFYDSTYSTYRISRVWEQRNSTGTPPNNFSYGTELIGTNQILNSQYDTDQMSHGTSTAAIASGSGALTGKYRGIAPASELVFVGLSEEISEIDILDGVKYIFDYAESQGKPCVINLSLGLSGPLDGLSLGNTGLDALTGNGKIVVCAAGNNGANNNHIYHSFSVTQDTIQTLHTSYKASTSTVQVWAKPAEEFSMSFGLYNVNTGLMEDYTPFISSTSSGFYTAKLIDQDLNEPDTTIIYVEIGSGTFNNKPYFKINIDHTKQDENFKMISISITANSSSIDMWSENEGFTDVGSSSFISGNNQSSLDDFPATCKSTITVGAYTSNNIMNWYPGIPLQIAPSAGPIANFSSIGPTSDSRMKPEIIAPGQVVTVPVNGFDLNKDHAPPLGNILVDVLQDNGVERSYVAKAGTSISSPFVAGTIALLLQTDPTLNYNQAIELLKNSAIQDEHTGVILNKGNQTWGWGKLNTHQAVLNLLTTTNITTTENESTISVYPNPNSGNFSIDLDEPSKYTGIKVINSLGHIAWETTVINSKNSVQHLSSGIYYIILSSDQGIICGKIIIE